MCGHRFALPPPQATAEKCVALSTKGSQTERLQKVKKTRVEKTGKSPMVVRNKSVQSLCASGVESKSVQSLCASGVESKRHVLLESLYCMWLPYGRCYPLSPDMFMRARFTIWQEKGTYVLHPCGMVCVLDICRDLCIQFPIF
jgi:hypothetical protein